MEYVVYKGNRYKKTKEGYYIRTERLHRRIWEDANGPIPEKHHIHHKNGIKDDNRLENLECISENDHPHEHFNWEEQTRILHKARDAAVRWHRSDEGRLWHQANGIASWEKRGHLPYCCKMCGVVYKSRNQSRPKYCSQVCRSRAQYLRDRIKVNCVICKKEFETFKKKRPARACSPRCGSLLTALVRKEKKRDPFSTII